MHCKEANMYRDLISLRKNRMCVYLWVCPKYGKLIMEVKLDFPTEISAGKQLM